MTDAGGGTKKRARLEKPPNKLKVKAPRIPRSKTEENLKKANGALRKLRGKYQRELNADMAVLRDEMRLLKQDVVSTGLSEDRLQGIFRIVHNMRGQAATFGYPLVTEVGRSFCLYILETEDPTTLNIDLLEQHVNALEVIRREHIAGKGDAISREVLKALMQAVESQTLGAAT